MAKEIIFSPEANDNLKNIIYFILDEWSLKIAEDFLEILDNKLNSILLFPKAYPQIEAKPEIRKCVLTKQVILYYRISEKSIDIITLFDSRQNSDKLKL